VACADGPTMNPLQNKEIEYMNIDLECMHQFFEKLNMKGNHPWIEWLAFKS
jgi:hypothetical protein